MNFIKNSNITRRNFIRSGATGIGMAGLPMGSKVFGAEGDIPHFFLNVHVDDIVVEAQP